MTPRPRFLSESIPGEAAELLRGKEAHPSLAEFLPHNDRFQFSLHRALKVKS